MNECRSICRLSQLAGLPIYAKDTGRKLGTVHDVIFDPSIGQLEAVSVETPGAFSTQRRFVLVSDIQSVGEDAIMVANEAVLRLPRDAATEDDIADDGITLMGKNVITECGTSLGSVSDVIINPATGRVEKYEVSGGSFKDVQAGRRTFPVPSALVVGRDALVVPTEVEHELEAQPAGGLQATYAGTRAGAADFWSRTREWWQRTSGRAAASTAEQEARFAIGKTAGSDVTDALGNLIVSQGDTITGDVVDHARSAGKLHQLALSAGWGSTKGGYEAARGRVTGAAREREEQFVLGKVTDRTIKDDYGNVIVGEGSLVTQKVVDRATEAGKLGDLASSVASAQARGLGEQVSRKGRELAGAGTERLGTAREEADMRRLTTEQRDMAKGQVAAVDIVDAQGNVIVHEGEIFTPMILDRLEDEGLLDRIHLKPIMGPERRPSEEAVPRIELLVRAEDLHAHEECPK